MDRNTIIGIILIVLIVLITPYYQRWLLKDKIAQYQAEHRADSLAQVSDTLADSAKAAVEAPEPAPVLAPAEETEQPQPLQSIQDYAETIDIEIENNLVHAVLSNEQGGNLKRWELKRYQYYLGGLVNLIDENGLDAEFTNQDGQPIELEHYRLYPEGQLPKKIVLDENNPTATISFYLPLGQGRLIKTFRFYYNKYSFDVVLKFERLGNYVINRQYFFNWENGVPGTEENLKEDFSYANAYALMADELENLRITKKKEEEKELTGQVNWAAVRTKYFVASIIPAHPKDANGVTLKGRGLSADGILVKKYDTELEMRYDPEVAQSDTFTVFLGPLDYGVLKSYHVELEKLVLNKDWYERLFRPISLIILWAFKHLHDVIPNYGFVIIIFSILIKLILHPLTKKSYQSMSEMQFIQPKVNEIREKYKDDPQRMQREMMRLYKEHGINPLGGCLPMLLQMPLLFALFIVFRSTIQLRHQPFILWITDLSAPDKLALGVSLPLIGSSIHVLPVIMGITMIWQSKMSITDPKQKFMAYIMPAFMIFIFYNLPSGLNLYYTLFNLFSMVQTRMIKKKLHPEGQPAAVAEQARPAAKPQPRKRSKPRRR